MAHTRYWIIKSEPAGYSWDQLVEDGKTDWTGVRNFQARNNLRSMHVGDKILYYHSGSEKAIVGIAEVVAGPYRETAENEAEWTAVDVKPIRPLDCPISLARIRADKRLSNMALLRQSRLSVLPLTKEEFVLITQMGSLNSKRSNAETKS